MAACALCTCKGSKKSAEVSTLILVVSSNKCNNNKSKWHKEKSTKQKTLKDSGMQNPLLNFICRFIQYTSQSNQHI